MAAFHLIGFDKDLLAKVPKDISKRQLFVYNVLSIMISVTSQVWRSEVIWTRNPLEKTKSPFPLLSPTDQSRLTRA